VTQFLAGSARRDVSPPLGLPMLGVVRRDEPAHDRCGALEVTACALARGDVRVIICGVDTLAVQSPEADTLRERVAAATGALPAAVLLNWNHTHHAPPGGRSCYGTFGERDPEPDAATIEYVDFLHDAVVETCREAVERVEPAWIRWGLGYADESVNRREREPDGMVRRIGWNAGGMVDRSVPTLQAVRLDGSAIATVIGFACHTVTTGIDFIGYSPDYPGPMRDVVRDVTGGECVFLQGAAGNIMPRFAFDDTLTEFKRMGRRLGLEALHALTERPAWPAELVETSFQSGTQVVLFRWRPVAGEAPALAAAEERVDLPLLPLPSLDEARAARERAEVEYEAAVERGATEPELRMLRYHGLNFARRSEAEIAGGNPRTAVAASVHAIRIGDGAIVTAPGEIFAEIGMAVRERSPADVTLYAGYTNGCVSYIPCASEYPLGGYEPAYGNKTYGLPAAVSPEADRMLVETGTRLVRSLFPERAAPATPDDWLATGALPPPPAAPPLERPPIGPR
jgi:neutral ceramidase